MYLRASIVDSLLLSIAYFVVFIKISLMFLLYLKYNNVFMKTVINYKNQLIT